MRDCALSRLFSGVRIFSDLTQNVTDIHFFFLAASKVFFHALGVPFEPTDFALWDFFHFDWLAIATELALLSCVGVAGHALTLLDMVSQNDGKGADFGLKQVKVWKLSPQEDVLLQNQMLVLAQIYHFLNTHFFVS